MCRSLAFILKAEEFKQNDEDTVYFRGRSLAALESESEGTGLESSHKATVECLH